MSTLEAAHFEAVTFDDTQSPQPAGTVVSQSPAPGSLLMQGEPVSLFVSTGEGLTTVPDVVGLDVAAARIALTEAGFTVGETLVADEAAAGTVLSQDPGAGGMAALGSAVALLVSTGPVEPPPE